MRKITDKQKHKYLPLFITHVHNHTHHFAVTKIALPYVNVWLIELAWGATFATAYCKCAVLKHCPFIPCIGHKQEICKHYPHKYHCRDAGTVNSTVLCPWCPSCSITHLQADAFRLFKAVLFLLTLYREKGIESKNLLVSYRLMKYCFLCHPAIMYEQHRSVCEVNFFQESLCVAGNCINTP